MHKISYIVHLVPGDHHEEVAGIAVPTVPSKYMSIMSIMSSSHCTCYSESHYQGASHLQQIHNIYRRLKYPTSLVGTCQSNQLHQLKPFLQYDIFVPRSLPKQTKCKIYISSSYPNSTRLAHNQQNSLKSRELSACNISYCEED